MRDRRNTNLSISLSPSSASSSPTTDNASFFTDKGRFLWAPAQPSSDLPSPYIKAAQQRANEPFLTCWGRQRSILKYLCLAAVALTLCTTQYFFRFDQYLDFSTQHTPIAAKQFHVSNDQGLLGSPGAVLLNDGDGRQKWTLSMGSAIEFPLEPTQYADMCKSAESVSTQVRQSSPMSRIIGKHGMAGRAGSYYALNGGYIDIREAEEAGILPTLGRNKPLTAVGFDTGSQDQDDRPICEKSLTYVMETDEAGFGPTMLALWLSYGLAMQEGRAFFINDDRWAYGNYTTFFQTPPLSSCRPPPRSQAVPCPHQARHLVVSAATAHWTFGEAFENQFNDKLRLGARKQKPLFDLVRVGYEALFHITKDDDQFLQQRLTDLKSAAASTGFPTTGMHIRRGDRHPFELEYSKDYLPLERFTSAAEYLLKAAPSTTRKANTTSSFLVASDDPDVLVHPDLVSTLPSDITLSRAQERIVLASKRTLEPAVPLREPGSAYTKHVDENSGWEGGFFAALFESLGKASHPLEQPSPEEKVQLEQQAFSLKELVGRAYLLDLAVMSQADGVVCAVSSASCRALGVMMGWEKVVQGKWVNVDDGRSWSWNGAR